MVVGQDIGVAAHELFLQQLIDEQDLLTSLSDGVCADTQSDARIAVLMHVSKLRIKICFFM